MSNEEQIPQALEAVRDAARRALGTVCPPDKSTLLDKEYWYFERTNAGRNLPDYYLVYFLLVDLLGFKNFGRDEKTAWCVPIDFNGRAFTIEHRKMGLGVFSQGSANDEDQAKEIVKYIHKAVKVARPFFDWKANEAIKKSAVNVINNSRLLFDRYAYLVEAFLVKSSEVERRKNECIAEEGTSPDGTKWWQYHYPAYQLRREAEWLAMSAIEAFFSWTEHVLIHIAILTGQISTAEEVTALAEADWSNKFKVAIDIKDPTAKELFDKLLAMRRELRNYFAHGAFGKQGEAFSFHSTAGAVPVLMPHRVGTREFTLGHGMEFDFTHAIKTVQQFIEFLWSGEREPAKAYLQKSDLPTILTLAADGTYKAAMASQESMDDLIEYESYQADQAANMEW